MKKYILPFTGLLFILASCSRYQASTISSTNTLKDERTGVFNMENDSVKIAYSFYGVNAPVEIQVYNKLDKPLYIDWQQSAVIVGNDAVSYAGKDVQINGNVNSNSYRVGSINSTSGNLNAVATLPTKVTFLPPHSRVSYVPLTVVNGLLNVPDSSMSSTKVYYFDPERGSLPVRAKSATYTQETSPLKFKSYLTLYTTDGDGKKVMAYQQEFFVSQLIATKANPKNLENYRDKRGDIFVTSTKTGYGKFMTGVGVAAAVGTAAALSTSAGNNANH